jgi:hypothetical protein
MKVQTQKVDEKHGWINTGTVKTRFGDFTFKGGYPTGDTMTRLFELQKVYRAVEVYLTNIMEVGETAVHEGLHAFGATRPNQVVIWEQLMGPETVLLTANTETVYAIGQLDLKSDGPTVVEAPPHMLGFIQNALQRQIADIGPLGADKGHGGKFLLLPPDFDGDAPEGYFTFRSPTYAVMIAMRGFQKDGSTAQAVELIKRTKIYPLSQAASPPVMEFINGSGKPIDTLFPDNGRYFDLLAKVVNEEPAESFGPLERAQMKAIGIERGKPFDPDAKSRALLDEAAQIASAIARAHTFASPEKGIFYYPDRQWQQVREGLDYTFTQDGVPQVDARVNVYYMAAGNSPGMMEKNVGQGSQYLWTYRDADGEWLQDDNSYRLHVLPNIPAGNFWSVVVYDALSRSELQGSLPLPSVSSYTHPVINADGSLDIAFGPEKPKDGGNWIQTVPGKGWFPIFRFYGPLEPFFDKSWILEDIEKVN